MIVMDSRERAKNPGIFRALISKIGEDNVMVDKLLLGDYLIQADQPRLIERMTSNEILSSRKMAQIEGMVVDNPEMKSFILFEGRVREIFKWRKIRPNSVYGKLLAILDGWNVSILYSEDKKETVDWLVNFHRRATEKGEAKKYIRPSARKKASLAEQQLWVLSSIRGLGRKYAERLLQHFGSVRAVLGADVETLCEVEGIKKARARQIVTVATGTKVEK